MSIFIAFVVGLAVGFPAGWVVFKHRADLKAKGKAEILSGVNKL